MKTEQEQRQAIRQILFDANDICQATPCENEYCIYHGDDRCYDNIIVDKLIEAGYGDISEYKSEIERLNSNNGFLQCVISHSKDMMDEAVKEAQIDVLNKLKKNLHIEDFDTPDERWKPESEFCAIIDKLIKEIEEQ